MAQTKVFLIDGQALCYRCFFAIRALATSKGQPTNAVYGFVRIIRNILRQHRPDYMAVCFDSPQKTRRQEKFAEYKIQRPPMPDELRSQIPLIKEIMKAFNVVTLEMGGFEADDIIATLSRKLTAENLDVVIVSDDKDMYQLAGENVKFFGSKNGAVLDSRGVEDKLGFDPRRIADFIGLAGDPSDNIPGVKGIGAVNARQLINEFGDLETVIKHLERIKAPNAKERLVLDQKKTAMFSKELALLDTAVPIKHDLKAFEVRAPDRDRLFAIFQDLEFRTLAEEFASGEAREVADTRAVSAPSEIESLADRIRKDGQFVFTAAESAQGGLFEQRRIFIAFGGSEAVYAFTAGMMAPLKTVFEHTGILKVTYDIKEMLKIFARHKIGIAGKVFDVMLAAYLLDPSQPSYDLKDLIWRYAKEPMPGDRMAGGGVLAIGRLHPLLRRELEERSLLPLFEDIEVPLAHVLFKVEENGVNLDLALLEKLSADCAGKIDDLTGTLYAMAGEAFNLNSPKQLSRILFEKLKLPVLKKTKTGFSTNEAVLTVLAENHAFPSAILEYRQLAKLKSTYIDALPRLVNPETGRVHARFHQTGTETGRLSSSRPNLQNIPIRTELGRQIRRAFIPSQEGFIMIAADYSQIELRILAHLSGDANLIKAFKNGEDIHAFTASLIFDVAEKDVTPQMRNSAKRVNFGIIYGMSAFGLAKDLNVSQPEAQEFIDRYFLRYPAVKKFMDDEIEKCEKNGYVLTLLNRRRYIPEIHSENDPVKQFARRQAVNTPVQGSAADLMKLAMINIQKEIEKHGMDMRMISTVHDELVFESPVGERGKAVELIRRHMEHAVALKVPIAVIVKTGKNWLEMEEVS